MDPEVDAHVHESPKLMTLPLVVLAVLAAVGGLVGIPYVLGGGAHFEKWIGQTVGHGEVHHGAAALEITLMVVSVGVALLGIFAAFVFFMKRTELPARFVAKWPRLHRTVWNKYYVDELNDAAVVLPLKRVSTNFLWLFIDAAVIDGAANGVGFLAKRVGGGLRRMQTGHVYAYALSIVVGAAAVLGVMLWRL